MTPVFGLVDMECIRCIAAGGSEGSCVVFVLLNLCGFWWLVDGGWCAEVLRVVGNTSTEQRLHVQPLFPNYVCIVVV